MLPGAAARREKVDAWHSRLGHGNPPRRSDAMDASAGVLKVGDIIFDEYRVLGRLPLPPKSLLELDSSIVDRGRNMMSWDFPLHQAPEERSLLLDEGAHGVAFLVHDSQDYVFVLKFWHVDGEYVTWKKLSRNKFLEKHLLRAANECSALQKLDDTAEDLTSKSNTAVLLKGSQRLVHCYGHNVVKPNTTEDNYIPLFMKLSYAGLPWNLIRSFPDLDAMRGLIKQLFEGLAFLNAAGWVHHDLKTENLVVKPAEGNVFALHIIDFDGAVEPSFADPSDTTTSTNEIAPRELERKVSNFKVCPNMEPDECPYAFDVFSAGITALEMVCGKRLDKVLGWAFDTSTDRWKYEELEKISSDTLLDTMEKQCEDILPFATAVQNTTFWTLLRNTLLSNAEKRPTAMAILESDWLKDVHTPDDFELDASALFTT